MPDHNRATPERVLAGMFGAIALLGAIAVAYGIGGLSGQQDGRRVKAAARHEANAKEQAAQACADVLPARMFECVHGAVEAAQESRQNEQDLSAQQGMHFWAVGMVIVGLIQTLVAGAALWFLKADLRQNRTSAEQQLRAYVGIHETTLIPPENILHLGEIEIILKNFGTTPATRVESVISIAVIPHEDDVRHYPKTWDFVGQKIAIDIMPQATGYRRILLPQTASDFRVELRKGSRSLWVRVELEYSDVFGRRYWQMIYFESRGKNFREKILRILWHEEEKRIDRA